MTKQLKLEELCSHRDVQNSTSQLRLISHKHKESLQPHVHLDYHKSYYRKAYLIPRLQKLRHTIT